MTTTSITPRFLVDLLDEAGRPPDDLLERAGLTRAALRGPDIKMTLAHFRELWARAAAVRPDVGVALIERFPPGQMHFIGHLAMRCADVRGLLESGSRFLALASGGYRATLERDGDCARYVVDDYTRGQPNPWVMEHFFCKIALLIERASGRRLPLRAIELALPRQAPVDAYVRRFGLAPRFDTGRNLLAFDARVLDWPLATADAYLHGMLERLAIARQAELAATPYDLARREIAAQLLKGRTPELARVATACGATPRALREALTRVDLTFRKLLDEGRRDLARDHLARGLSIAEAAYLLGFSEPAAFQHACRRWFGEPAGAVRKTLLAEARV